MNTTENSLHLGKYNGNLVAYGRDAMGNQRKEIAHVSSPEFSDRYAFIMHKPEGLRPAVPPMSGPASMQTQITFELQRRGLESDTNFLKSVLDHQDHQRR